MSLHRENGNVVISVADNGIGLVSESLEAVFEMFSQADLSTNWAYGGLGIGLSPVRQMVKMHRGTVHLASLGLDR